MALLITGTLPGMAVTTAPVLPPMDPTAAPTPALAIIPPQARTRAARRPRRRMAPKRSGRPTTHTPGPMAQPIKVPTPIRTGEARRPRRTARPWTRSITQTRMDPLGQPRPQAVTNMRPRTATPTRTREVAGRRQVLLMPHTVMEAAVDRTSTAAAHRHSAAGATTLGATPAGGPGPRALAAGAVAAEAEVGVAADSMEAADSGASPRVGCSQKVGRTISLGGSK